MEIVLLLARVFLALVFGIAGIAKIADAQGSRRAVVAFGVPERFATPLAWGLPFAEILIALSLISLSTAWLGSIAGLALLLVFAAGIALTWRAHAVAQSTHDILQQILENQTKAQAAKAGKRR